MPLHPHTTQNLENPGQPPAFLPEPAPSPPSPIGNIVILISGSGSNMAALVNAARAQCWKAKLGVQIAAVISNRLDAGGLERARSLGLAAHAVPHSAFASREDFDAALQTAIDPYAPRLVLLAGFMRVLTPAFVAHYSGKLLNIHPSLLPAFPGLHTHQRAIDTRCTVAGATVHWVTADLDSGPNLAQAVVPVLPHDTAQSLAARVLTQEHLLYPMAVRDFLQKQNSTLVSALSRKVST